MSKSNVTIDSSQINQLFDSLNQDTQRQIMMKGLEKGGKVLQKATRQRLLQKMPVASRAIGASKKPMAESIRIIKDKDYSTVIVSIMKHYLNVFFEGGTDGRYLRKEHRKDSKHHRTYKKGEYRGRIKPLNFFAEARKESENDIINAIEEEIIKQLNKLFR